LGQNGRNTQTDDEAQLLTLRHRPTLADIGQQVTVLMFVESEQSFDRF